jgi:hypothetical protein
MSDLRDEKAIEFSRQYMGASFTSRESYKAGWDAAVTEVVKFVLMNFGHDRREIAERIRQGLETKGTT